MQKYFEVMEQSSKEHCYDEWVVYTGTDWKQALKEWQNVKKGYFNVSTNHDKEIRFTSQDETNNIIYTRGWDHQISNKN